ncbi:MAG TPA: hypothetical protein DF715_13860, partial [Oceanicaulis sp.]|nr:hypothetical protein [Oceanicaulis sp.]
MKADLRGLSLQTLAVLAAGWLTACDFPHGTGGPGNPSGYAIAAAEIGDIREVIPAVGPVRAATEV